MHAAFQLLCAAAFVAVVTAAPYGHRVEAPLALPNFTGYIVTAQWDGRTVPNVQWALDVTRQDPEYRFNQELKLANMLPTTEGPALKPSYTAYDAATRSYFLATCRNQSAAYLWGMVIAGDVGSVTRLSPQETTFAYPEEDDILVGLEIMNSTTSSIGIAVLAIFADGKVVTVDWETGKTAPYGMLVNGTAQVMSTSISIMPAKGSAPAMLVAIVRTPKVDAFAMLPLGQAGATPTFVDIKHPLNQDLAEETPFEMVWLPSLGNFMLFYTGNFDQLLYADPLTGKAEWAIPSITEYSGGYGNFMFTENDRLEDDDTWANAVYDDRTKKIYFQCTEVTDDDDETTSLCQIDIPAKVKQLDYINVAIAPMTYGYVGMQWVYVA